MVAYTIPLARLKMASQKKIPEQSKGSAFLDIKKRAVSLNKMVAIELFQKLNENF